MTRARDQLRRLVGRGLTAIARRRGDDAVERIVARIKTAAGRLLAPPDDLDQTAADLDLAAVSRLNEAAWDEASDVHAPITYQGLLEGFARPGFSCIRGVKQQTLLAHGLAGKAVFQPCCNNGRDLLSLKNLGAARCVGVDLSGAFIAQGRDFAAAGGIDCELVHSDIYALGDRYDGQFDIAYITSGTLGPLGDLDRFFATVARVMKPGAWLFMQEIHPVANLFGMETSTRHRTLRLRHDYFDRGPVIAREGLDYYRSIPYAGKPHVRFHDTLSDIVQAVIDQGMTLETLKERPGDSSGGRFMRVVDQAARPPLSVVLTARKG